jgi:hypothetical protein
MAARIVAGPTSRRPCRRANLEEALNKNAQYPGIPSKVLQGSSCEEVIDDVVAVVAMSVAITVKIVNLDRMECGDIHISCIAAKSLAKPPEACRPKEGLKSIAPKHLEALGRAIRCAPHREAFIPDVKSLVSRAGWQGLQKHTDLERSCIQDAQPGW